MQLNLFLTLLILAVNSLLLHSWKKLAFISFGRLDLAATFDMKSMDVDQNSWSGVCNADQAPSADCGSVVTTFCLCETIDERFNNDTIPLFAHKKCERLVSCWKNDVLSNPIEYRISS